jgi:hypothetical protein
MVQWSVSHKKNPPQARLRRAGGGLCKSAWRKPRAASAHPLVGRETEAGAERGVGGAKGALGIHGELELAAAGDLLALLLEGEPGGAGMGRDRAADAGNGVKGCFLAFRRELLERFHKTRSFTGVAHAGNMRA